MPQWPRAAVARASGVPPRWRLRLVMPRAATADRRSPVAGSRTVRSMRNAWAAWGNRPPRAGRTCKVRVSARPWPASVSVPSVSVPSVSVPSVSVPSVSVPSVSVPSVSVPSVSVPSVSVPSVSVPSVSVPSVSVPSVSVPSVSRCRIEPHLDQARRLRRRGPASAPASALEGRAHAGPHRQGHADHVGSCGTQAGQHAATFLIARLS